jgi:hypothetical protein
MVKRTPMIRGPRPDRAGLFPALPADLLFHLLSGLLAAFHLAAEFGKFHILQITVAACAPCLRNIKPPAPEGTCRYVVEMKHVGPEDEKSRHASTLPRALASRCYGRRSLCDATQYRSSG